jgi:hypothetical protein
MNELNEHELELKAGLERLRDLKIQNNILADFAYRGMEDFVLRHGVWYRPNGFPPKQGAPKSCFGNAIVIAAAHRVKYIEGFALPGSTLIAGVRMPSLDVPRYPIHHAWNLDVDEDLADTTWMNTGLAYIGVEFSVGRADNCTWFDNATVLDNPRNGFAILRQPWTGENYNRVWRKSKAMKQILRARTG